MLFGEGPQIKNIAADLNKLFRQGSLLNQIGQTVEGDSTADQGTSDLLAARDPVIQEISVGMSGEQSARCTVSGTPPLSLPNSLGKPLKAWSVDLLPYQEGTGDPAPDNVRPIHGTDKVTVVTSGKNMLPPFGNKTVDGLTVTANADGSLTIRGIATSSGAVIADAVTLIDPIPANTTVTFSTKNNVPVTLRILINPNGAGDIPANGNYISFTRPNVITGARLYLYTTIDAEYDFTIFPQLELGSTPTGYIPYVAPSSTTVTLPQTVYNGTVGSDGGESRWALEDLGDYPWTYVQPSTTFPNGLFYANFTDKVRSNELPMCTEYKPVLQAYGNQDFVIAGSDTGLIYMVDSRYNTPVDFRNSVRGVKVCYRLAAPIQFAMTTPAIPTPTGTAVAWATAEDGTVESMEVTYVGKA